MAGMRIYKEEWNRGMAMTGGCASAFAPDVTIEVRQKMERSAKNKLWAMSNMDKLRSKYANKYVALDNGSVLAFGDSPDEVFKELRKKKIKDISTIAIEFVPEDLLVWLL
jgi:ABC-type hemin transport system substrate-binding protein